MSLKEFSAETEGKHVKELANKLFLARYHMLFEKMLQKLDANTRQVIRSNKQLDEMYDLFLDFVLDSAQQLEFVDKKSNIKA